MIPLRYYQGSDSESVVDKERENGRERGAWLWFMESTVVTGDGVVK